VIHTARRSGPQSWGGCALNPIHLPRCGISEHTAVYEQDGLGAVGHHTADSPHHRVPVAHFSRPILVLSLSCSSSVLLVFSARSFTYSSTRSPPSIPYSMSLLLALCRPPYDRTSLQANSESSTPCLAPCHEYCILNNLPWCCRSAVPHTRPSSLARQRPYGCPLCAKVCLASRARHVALAVAVAKATLCPLHPTLRTLGHEHPLPESILRSAVKSSVFHRSLLYIPTSF